MNSETFDRNRLSTREDAILEQAIEGLTDAQIAQKLDISQSTVNSYWVRIRGKLGQLSRTELVALALKQKAQREMDAVSAQIAALQQEAKAHTRLVGDFANAEIYRAALDAMPEAVLAFCDKGIVRYANSRIEALFGYGEGEMIEMSALNLAPGPSRTTLAARLAEYIADPHPVRVGLSEVVYAQRRDGSQFRVVLLVDSRPTSATSIFTCLVRNFATEIDARRQYASAWA